MWSCDFILTTCTAYYFGRVYNGKCKATLWCLFKVCLSVPSFHYTLALLKAQRRGQHTPPRFVFSLREPIHLLSLLLPYFPGSLARHLGSFFSGRDIRWSVVIVENSCLSSVQISSAVFDVCADSLRVSRSRDIDVTTFLCQRQDWCTNVWLYLLSAMTKRTL